MTMLASGSRAQRAAHTEVSAFGLLVAALLSTGAISRLAPLFDRDDRLLQAFPTEDGYFMLTMGRNIALGHGLSVAAGTTPTNGTQPLATFLFSIGYALAGGDKRLGVLFTLIFEFTVACLAAYALYRLGRHALQGRRNATAIAALAAAIWFASPLVVPHSMNCQETGLYGLAAVCVAWAFAEREGRAPWTLGRCVAAGVLLGLAFLARIDAVFLIAAACLTYLWGGLGNGQFRERLKGTLVMGSISVLVASSWLYFNYTRFGHLMPVSGRAERLTGHFAENLPGVPPVLFEYVTAVCPIPSALQGRAPVVALTSLGVLAVGALLWRLWGRMHRAERSLLVLTALYAGCLCVYYGLFFGAPWFLARYLFPISPFLALLWVTVVTYGWTRVPAGWLRRLARIAPVLLMALIGALTVRTYHTKHMHFQVIRWVERNVPENVWVGGIQTGTLGYFHDQTVNLDGKVNPAALEAEIEHRIPQYVVASKIQYLADWVGIVDWMKNPLIAENFDVVLNDPRSNLGVLKRKQDTGVRDEPSRLRFDRSARE